MRIRQAYRLDSDAVAAIGRDTYVEHFAHIWSSAGLQSYIDREFDPAAIAAEMTSGNVSYFLFEEGLLEAGRVELGLAESGGGAIGFAKLRHPRPMPVSPALNGAELQKIYLRQSSVRRGAGLLLLDACVKHVMHLGLDLLWLDVLERNTQATRFYLRHGFEIAGKKSFQTDLGQEVMLVMTRALTKVRELPWSIPL